MPLSETFWSKSFGMFTDKFGIDWMVNLWDLLFMAILSLNFISVFSSYDTLNVDM